jgi:hypothetical protein
MLHIIVALLDIIDPLVLEARQGPFYDCFCEIDVLTVRTLCFCRYALYFLVKLSLLVFPPKLALVLLCYLRYQIS